MHSWSGLLSGAVVAVLSITLPAVASADPGDPGEPQVVAWVDGYTNFSGPQDQFLSGQGWLVDEEVEFLFAFGFCGLDHECLFDD